jgi:hypothetical protein
MPTCVLPGISMSCHHQNPCLKQTIRYSVRESAKPREEGGIYLPAREGGLNSLRDFVSVTNGAEGSI